MELCKRVSIARGIERHTLTLFGSHRTAPQWERVKGLLSKRRIENSATPVAKNLVKNRLELWVVQL